MSGRYLTDLASVVRGAGLVVQEEAGWTTRARSSGGYASGRPTHVMVHHTASNAGSDGQADVNYCCYGSDSKPVANLYLARSGKVWVMAAGATNTNGKGGPLDGVPSDSMNTYAIGIEAANNGVGEQWPPAQQDAYIRLTKALCSRYGILTAHVRAHFEWAPDRKIDPAGNSRYATGGAKWNMDTFRGDVLLSGGTPPPLPTPPPEDEPMPYVLKNTTTGAAIVVEAAGLRSIGGAELNYLAANFDVVNVANASEWEMALGARTVSVDVVE